MNGPRKFAGQAIRDRVSFKNNFLCRQSSPQELARSSSHLRNYAVAEMIAVMGHLDSHPSIKSRPVVGRDGAKFQQMGGTNANHFSHVAPCNILLDGKLLTHYFATSKAQGMIERIFGMGVTAPEDWRQSGSFSHAPAEQNRTDCIVERFKTNDGLVAAFEATLRAAAASGKWQGTGAHQHNPSSLSDYVEHFQRIVWRPAAEEAYQTALTDLSGQLVTAKSSSADDRARVLEQRIEIVDAQLQDLIQNPIHPSEATFNVLRDTAGEVWKK
jgi:hypothetical protein